MVDRSLLCRVCESRVCEIRIAFDKKTSPFNTAIAYNTIRNTKSFLHIDLVCERSLNESFRSWTAIRRFYGVQILQWGSDLLSIQ